MKIRLFSLLAAAILMLSSPMINALKFQTNDKRIFDISDISREAILEMDTIQTMLEEVTYKEGEVIPLPIDGATFERVIELLKIDNEEDDEDQWREKIKKYVSAIKDNAELVKLINAANYLEYTVVLDYSVAILRDRLKVIDSKKDVEDMAGLVLDIGKPLVLELLTLIRHKFEICRLINTTNFGIKTLLGHTDLVNSVAFSTDGKSIASGSLDKTIRIWDAKTGKPIKTFSGHTNAVNSVAFSPDGKSIVSGFGDNVGIWDVKTGNTIKTLEGHTDVSSVAFSTDGKSIASGSLDNTIIIWDVETGNLIKTLRGHTYYVYSVAFSPDGTTIASGSWDKTIRIWNVETGNLIKILRGHTHYVWSVTFSPDGKYIASGSLDKTIRIWDAKTGKPIKTFSGHTNAVNSVAFSPDGKSIASGSWDKTIKIWDVETGNPIKTLQGHTRSVYSVAFSPDGKHVASGSEDKTIIIWQLFDDETWKTLNKIITEDEKGNLTTQLTFEQALELIAAMNARKKGKPPEFEKITDFVLIDLIKQCQ